MQNIRLLKMLDCLILPEGLGKAFQKKWCFKLTLELIIGICQDVCAFKKEQKDETIKGISRDGAWFYVINLNEELNNLLCINNIHQ